MPLRQDRVRLIALIKKADGVSKEEFSRYWAEEHSHIFKANPVAQKNLLKYEQSHANDAVNKVLDAMGLHITHWDGVAVLEAESYEKIFEVLKSEYHQTFVVPDEDKLIDRPNCQILPLDLATIIDRQTIE